MKRIFLPLLVSFLVSLALTPLMRAIALKFNILDIPKDKRKIHKKGIPYLGGLAIFLATMVGVFAFLPYSNKDFLSFIVASTLLVAVGLWDDVKDLPAKFKLVVQIVAALILISGGVKIEFITSIFEDHKLVSLSVFSVPLSVLWIVGITNTINLIDGLDGLAAGVSSISAFSLMVVALSLGETETGVLSAVLIGALLGFLPYNFNPASIFMGDAGSLFIGLTLATISINGVMKSTATLALLTPIIILAVPFFDTVFAIFRRLLSGQHPMQADKGHLHHKLLEKNYTHRETALILYAISAFFGVVAVLLSKVGNTRVELIITILIFILVFVLGKNIGLLKGKKETEDEKD